MPDNRFARISYKNQTGGSDKFFDVENESGRRFPQHIRFSSNKNNKLYCVPLGVTISNASYFYLISKLNLINLTPLLFLILRVRDFTWPSSYPYARISLFMIPFPIPSVPPSFSLLFSFSPTLSPFPSPSTFSSPSSIILFLSSSTFLTYLPFLPLLLSYHFPSSLSPNINLINRLLSTFSFYYLFSTSFPHMFPSFHFSSTHAFSSFSQ